MGVTTFYKIDPDGSLWVKMQGTMDDVGIMDQLATVREVDLFNKWVPFCSTSKLLTRLGIVELIAYFSVSLPGLGRWVTCGTSASELVRFSSMIEGADYFCFAEIRSEWMSVYRRTAGRAFSYTRLCRD